jgi:hypothetical protein
MLKKISYSPIVGLEAYNGNFKQVNYTAQKHDNMFNPIYATVEEILLIANMAYFAKKIGMEFTSVTLLMTVTNEYRVEIR